MLKGKLIHPDILAVLGRTGHGSKVLIADGNYPFRTRLGPNAELVCLNLSPGVVTAVQVLEAVVNPENGIPVEKAEVMKPHAEARRTYGIKGNPVIWNDFQEVLHHAGANISLQPIERLAFYAAASTDEVALTIATGETALFANILLTIGLVETK